MTSYLLLRSNKESGPYSLEDLVRTGLKPYDLVWIQGKSAAWRYPSEIEELKPYAPVTEEQPYDRFYKKSSQEATPQVKETRQALKEETAVVPTAAETQPKPVIDEKYQKYIPEEKYEKYIPKKSVFVTMPGQKTVNSSKPVIAEPPSPAVPAATITVTENPVAAQVKYSQPLDEIKEMYVKTLQERKSKIARKSFLLVNLKRAAVILGLVAVGVLAGFAIKSNSGNKGELARQTVKQVTDPSVAVSDKNDQEFPDPALPEASDPVPGDEPSTAGQTNESTEKVSLPPVLKEQLLRQEKQQVIRESSRKAQPGILTAESGFFEDRQAAKGLEKDPVTGERSRKLRNESIESSEAVTDDRPVAKARKNNGLANFVSVTSNDYKRVAFGGIRNLELTVTNDSKYKLDKVTVELQYLKPSEEPLKTELVQFHSVSPNGSLTMRIRDTNRGIKVLYKIVDIQPQQPETAMSGF